MRSSYLLVAQAIQKQLNIESMSHSKLLRSPNYVKDYCKATKKKIKNKTREKEQKDKLEIF